MTTMAKPDYQQMLRRLYDETLAADFRCVEEVFHPDYRSMTEAYEDSPAAYIEATRKMLQDFEILEREVLCTLGDDRHVAILHRARFRPRDGQQPAFEHLRVDIYQIEAGRFLRHWGVPPL
ncbi:MAG: hypothetical protein AB7R89_18515 [Dehalococcoidia bacterium]